ncbi:hypothetical protein [Mesoterricola silvestris]|uniref:Uncharacterized protein n=1 Tax=Mesoterricola silvestris TaxID=2927979 RepID=A0AA48GG84_9BACT|nr:hypothetical protein [Mesoterricola silvestris]BDU72206.1 hypothetical protein METEAL_13800 [Mesoterricola silvestris]
MKGERMLMALLLAGVPAVIVGAVILPSARRTAALGRRLDAAHATAQDARPFTPLGREERAVLAGPWRSRIAWVPDDAARLAQVDRVVTQVHAAFAAKGVRVAGMKVATDPVRADFTLPSRADRAAFPAEAAQDGPERRVDGWVLDVEVAGPTGDLFKALAAVADVDSLLEPVGLTWEAGPDRPATQHLHLRVLQLRPGS